MMLHQTLRRLSAVATLLFIVALGLSGCAGSASPVSDLDSRLIGAWTNDGGSLYTISDDDGDYALSVVDDDGEVFEVESVTWSDGALSWTYFVPSTNYRVSEVTTRISADRLDLQWENQTGDSGVDTLTRVE